MIPPVVHASYAMILLSLLFLLPTFYFIWAAQRGKELYIRRIPGIDAIEEAIGRATELGRPIIFTTGLTGLGPLLFAVLGILTHVAKKAAAFGCRLILPQFDYTVMPVIEDTARQAYRAAGRLDQFNPQEVRFLSDQQFAFASGYMGIAHREKAATCFLFGSFAAESLILAEAGQQVGAMQVAGTPDYNQIPFFITSCDYTLIGEEVYAAGAYLSREPSQLGSIRGQDAAKLVVLALVAAGLVLGTYLSIRHSDTKEGATYNSPLKELLYAAPQQARALARIEIQNQYKPEEPPEHPDLEAALAASRARLAGDARRVRSVLGRIAALTRSEERAVREALGLIPEGPARDDAARLAAGLADVAAHAEAGAADFARLLDERLPALQRDLLRLRRERAAEAAKAELACLEAWAARQSGPGAESCRGLLAAAAGAVGTGTAPGIEAAVRRAREACYAAYFAEVRKIMAALERAAGEKTPAHLVRTGKEGTPLVLDGAKSVSGRLLPLKYAWTLAPVGSSPAKVGEGAQAEQTFEKPGAYRIGLAVSEQQEPLTLPLPLGGAERSALKHQVITLGTAIRMGCPLAKTVVPGSESIRWDLDGDGRFEKTDLTAEYRCEQPGCRVLTVEANYRERIEEEAGGETRHAAAAAAPVAGGVRGVRRRLGVGLPDIAERLAEVNGRLGRMLGEAGGYAKPLAPLDYAKGLSAPAWPDRQLAAEAAKSIAQLRDWGVNQASRFLLQAAAQAETLGAPSAAVAAAGAEPPGQVRTEELARYKRYRIYLDVVRPAEDSAELAIEVREAPELPRAPWAPPEAAKGAAGAGAAAPGGAGP